MSHRTDGSSASREQAMLPDGSTTSTRPLTGSTVALAARDEGVVIVGGRDGSTVRELCPAAATGVPVTFPHEDTPSPATRTSRTTPITRTGPANPRPDTLHS